MGSTPTSPLLTEFFGRSLKLFIFIFAVISLLSSVKETKGHPPHSADRHWNRETRTASEPLYTNGKGLNDLNGRQTSVLSQRQQAPVRRSVAATSKSEQRRVTRIPVAEKINIGELEKDPSTDSDEKTRAARKSPTAKFTVPVPTPSKKTTPSPLSIQVKTFTPKQNVSAVIEVIADGNNTSGHVEDKGEGKEPLIENVHLPENRGADELRLTNRYPSSTLKDSRAHFGTYPTAGEINEILPVEEIVLFGTDTGYGNQQSRPIYPPYASDIQSFVPGSAALGAMGYEPNVFLNALAPAPMVLNSLLVPPWLPGLQPHTQKYVTRSFHLKLDPKMEWVPI